jgi:hypothetical protein
LTTSHTVTASGGSVIRNPYIALVAAAATGSGHEAGCIDMTRQFYSRDEENDNGRSRIMTTITAPTEDIAQRITK